MRLREILIILGMWLAPLAPSPIPIQFPTATTTTTTMIPSTTTTSTIKESPSTTVNSTTTILTNDFWWELARCESGNGQSSDNQFQFMGGTAEKVGYYHGASYAEQKAMAIDWASRIHPNEGTRSGWPVCWWVAKRAISQ